MNDHATRDATLRNDFHVFFMKVFMTLHSEPLQPAWHVESMTYLAEQLRRGEVTRAIVNVPPRMLKSMVFSVALAAFVLGRDPTAKLLCVSLGQDLANTFSRQTRQVMESDWYRSLFPHTMLSKLTEERLETTVGGFRFATSPGGPVTGLGADYIIIDDPIKPDEAASEGVRDRIFRFYQQTLLSRLNDKARGRIVWVMQRVHEDDPCGRLLPSGQWRHLCLPAIATKDEDIPIVGEEVHHRRIDDVLHPAREPRSTLEDLRQGLGSHIFEAQYQQSPVPAEGLYVKARWLKYYNKLPELSTSRIVQSWDTAMKGDPKSNFSVCTTWAEQDGKYYLIDVFRAQLDLPELISAAKILYDAHAPSALLIEDHASGTGLIQTLRSSYAIHAIAIRPLQDKASRLINVTPMFESGQVLLPKDAPWLAPLETELLGFPNARYDDQVDSVTQCLTWAAERARSSTFEYSFFPYGPTGHDDIADAIIQRRFRL